MKANKELNRKPLKIWNVHRTGPQEYFTVLAGDHPEAYPKWTFVGSATARTEAEAISKVWSAVVCNF